jgi:hypothetical protein
MAEDGWTVVTRTKVRGRKGSEQSSSCWVCCWCVGNHSSCSVYQCICCLRCG